MSSDEEDVFVREEMPSIEEEPAPIEEKTNKKGKHKKPMSDERKQQLLENLRKGREKSLAKRKAKAQMKKEKPKEAIQEAEPPKPKKTIEKKHNYNREIDDDTKERIYKEMKKKESEREERTQLNNDIKDLKEKLNWLVNDFKSIKDKELKKEVKQEIKELKQEIKLEEKEEKKEEPMRPKTPPVPIIEEPAPKRKIFCPVRGTYYV
tara:strand:- start:21 stop:641 length:621 start_codon:yes stop_codon:yes gene_type:complete